MYTGVVERFSELQSNQGERGNSVRRLLQKLASILSVNAIDKPSKNVASISAPFSAITPGHVLHFVYLCDPSGEEAIAMETDENLYNSADILLEYFEKLVLIQIPFPASWYSQGFQEYPSQFQSRDGNILPNRAELFQSARIFVAGITEHMSRHYYSVLEESFSDGSSRRHERMPYRAKTETGLHAVLQDTSTRLRHLEEQINLHSIHRQKRLKALGWSQYLAKDSPSPNRSLESGDLRALMKEYEDMKEQFLIILQSAETRAYIHLINRLTVIGRDLQNNVILWLSDRYCSSLSHILLGLYSALYGRGEYDEAQRLRAICTCVQNTVFEQCSGGENDILDRVHHLLRDSVLLSLELGRQGDILRRQIEVCMCILLSCLLINRLFTLLLTSSEAPCRIRRYNRWLLLRKI
jgi:hypothetical protein